MVEFLGHKAAKGLTVDSAAIAVAGARPGTPWGRATLRSPLTHTPAQLGCAPHLQARAESRGFCGADPSPRRRHRRRSQRQPLRHD